MRVLARLAAIVGVIAASAATEAQADKRVALIVGIGAYKNLSTLANPVGDAQAVASALRGHGYQVFEHYDLGRGDFLNALEDFERTADQADLAIIYYAGHGMEIAGENVLAPIDTEVTCEPKQARRTVEVEDLFQALGRAKNQVVLLDACRDDPFPQCASRSARSGGGFRGLQRIVETDTSLIIANATLSGQLAADGDAGRHSPFAEALLARFATDGGRPLRDMLDSTARDVRQSTSGAQVPEITTQGGAPEICLSEGCNAAPQVAVTEQQTPPPVIERGEADDKVAYEAAVGVGTCGALEAFVAAFPSSFYATLAEERARTACAPPEPPQQQAAVPPPEPPPVQQPDYGSGFIFPDSSNRRLSREELSGLSAADLRIARNEIFARRGRFFRSADLDAHFRQYSWYQPFAWDTPLNATESYNVQLIQAEEKRR
ncbi:MAG: caspase family protein [Vicinamibacterales bacterium]